MKNRPGNRRTCQLNRVKYRHRSKRAGPSDIYFDLVQRGFLFLGGILECHCPLRDLSSCSYFSTQRETVHLDNGAVNIERQTPAHFAYLPDSLHRFVSGVDNAVIRDNVKSQGLHVFQRLGVRRQFLSAYLLKVEAEYVQLAAGGDGAVLLAERTCRSISRILRQWIAVSFLLLAEGGKALPWHIDLAAHLDELRSVIQSKRNRTYCFQICRDVLTDKAIATGGTTDEYSVLVLQRHGKTVNLWLYCEFVSPLFHYRSNERAYLLLAEYILKRTHLHDMLHLLKAAADRTSHAVCRRIRRGKLRVLLLDSAQFTHEGVVLVVLDRGIIQVIVVVIVLLDDCTQFRGALFCFLEFQSILRSVEDRPVILKQSNKVSIACHNVRVRVRNLADNYRFCCDY